jgi:hypothetical protein
MSNSVSHTTASTPHAKTISEEDAKANRDALAASEEQRAQPIGMRLQDLLGAIFAILAYLVLAVSYYCPKLGWAVSDTIYFAFATVTTVGFGDFNGSHDGDTMMFTTFFAFSGVGMIGLAIGEIMEEFRAVRSKKKRDMINQVATALVSYSQHHRASTSGENLTVSEIAPEVRKKKSLRKRFLTWSKHSAWTRVTRIVIPFGFVGLLGAAILLGTEDSESDIMQTESPFITSFYVSIVCGLSVRIPNPNPNPNP